MLNLRRGSLLSDFWGGGGGGPIPTYDTLQAVIDAALPDGSLWRIAWTGDAYEADGEVVGTIIAGDPSWRGVIPRPKIGAAATVVTTALSGALGADAQGRPRLTTIASNGSLVEVNLGLRLRTPTLYQLNIFHTQPAQADSTDSVLAAQLTREDNTSLRLWNYLAYTAGSWQSGHFQAGAGGVVSFPQRRHVNPRVRPSSRQAGPLRGRPHRDIQRCPQLARCQHVAVPLAIR
jgi:hypothetical protein